MNAPNPNLSLSFGNTPLNNLLCNTSASVGTFATTIIIGINVFTVFKYSYTSLSSFIYPNASPNATSLMTSSVKYDIFSPKSQGA
jgi:hypothetical protein